MFSSLVSVFAASYGSIILAILAVSALLVGVYVVQRGAGLVLAVLSGKRVFQGVVFTDSEWLDGMKAVHSARKQGRFVDAESSQAYNDWMRGSKRRRRR